MLQSLINSLGLMNHVHLKQYNSSIVQEFDSAQLFVTSNLLNCSELTVSSITSGCPVLVITHQDHSLPSTITHGYNGYVIDEDNTRELVDKTSTILIDYTLTQQLSKNAYHSAQAHNEERTVEQWHNVLNQVASKQGEKSSNTYPLDKSDVLIELISILRLHSKTITDLWQEHHTSNSALESTLLISISDGLTQAKVISLQVNKRDLEYRNWEKVFQGIGEVIDDNLSYLKNELKWVRVEWVSGSRYHTWLSFKKELEKNYKRNYFRNGIALTGINGDWLPLTEMELNANACLYAGNDVQHASINQTNLIKYLEKRFDENALHSFDENMPLWLFNTVGIFIDIAEKNCYPLANQKREWGKREVDTLNEDNICNYIFKSSKFLARQIRDTGQYIYGYFPCFDRRIDTYNVLRHASSTYSLLESYEFAQDRQDVDYEYLDYLQHQITNSLIYLQNRHIRHYDNNKAYVVDINDEIKLGANATCILAMVKFTQIFDNDVFVPLTNQLACGIESMQQTDGRFIHVLYAEDLKIKDLYRIIFYEGEATFALLRLYGLTHNERWLDAAARALDYYITVYDQAHDHWMSYTVNEIVKYRPEKKYFVFGVNNITGYVDYIRDRLTTFPTLLELSIAFHNMLLLLEKFPQYYDVLDDFDVEDFYKALHIRANYLLNGFFYPEIAMFYKSPSKIVNSFFIRHHAFRVRIDDVEHYLSGLIAYQKLLESKNYPKLIIKNNKIALKPVPIDKPNTCIVSWGGDVNLGRRQHFLTTRYGVKNVLDIPCLQQADYRIVNLECVISCKGEQGVEKGEGGSYYFRARPEMVTVLKAANIDLVACANNHSGDYGKEALLEQIDILNQANIGYVGIGHNRESAFDPLYKTLSNGITIAIYNVDATTPHFAAGSTYPGNAYINPIDPDSWTDIYHPLFFKEKLRGNLVLIAIHWGANGRSSPDKDEIEVGHRLIDAGADVILGSSAHYLQGVELYRNKPIIHDAGNLLFDSKSSSFKTEGAIFHLKIDCEEVYAIQAYPVNIGYGKTTANDAIEHTEYLAKLCKKMQTSTSILQDGSLYINIPTISNIQNKHPLQLSKPSNSVSQEDSLTFKHSNFSNNHYDFENEHTVIKFLPDDAKITPVEFGSIKLIGIRTTPHFFNRRKILWIESFWTTNELLEEDWRIHFRAKPLFNAVKMKPWGSSSAHDPCDWLIPTSRWKVGKIYRDFYGLRPPYFKTWENGSLQLEVSIISSKNRYPFVCLPFYYELHRPIATYSKNLPPYLQYRQIFPDYIYESQLLGTWNAKQLQLITGGEWIVEPPDNWYIDSIVAGAKHVDSAYGNVLFIANSNKNRTLHEGSSKEPNSFDRHNQVATLQNQLKGAIVSKSVENLDSSFPLLKVEDPIKAWIEIGIAARSRFSKPIIAITGTVGKTSTCNMVKAMLGGQNVLSSTDNYNTRVGALGTLASLSLNHKVAVIEVAQSALWMHRGPVTRTIQPNIALITEIGLTQTGVIKSLDHAIRTKCKIFDGLSGDAIAVVGAHLPELDKVIEYAEKYAKQVFIYGDHPKSKVRIESIETNYDKTIIKLNTDKGLFNFSIPLLSEGMAMNAIAAFCIAYVLDKNLNEAIAHIERYQGMNGRMQVIKVSLNDGTITLIDDSFNAAYDSMVNAFSFFYEQHKRENSRLIYVLGRIVNMADEAIHTHQSLAEPLLLSSPDLVITHGDEMKYLREKLPEGILGAHFSDVEALSKYVKNLWRKNDIILIKGSARDSDFSNLSMLLQS